MGSGVLVLAAVLAVALALGLVRRSRDGRLTAREGQLSSNRLGAALGPRATLVQFSSAFCAPCRATRRILEDVAATVPGVTHVELPVEDNLELVRELDVSRTPTVLVLDARGGIVRRAAGQPRKADVIAALGEAIPAKA